MFSNVLVPLDGSPEAATALPAAQALASSLGARISLLRVVRRPDVQFDMHVDEIREAAGYLDGVARELASSNLRVSTHARSGEVGEAIVKEISARGADLVVMATRGQGGVRRAVLGSVASEVISLARSRSCSCGPAVERCAASTMCSSRSTVRPAALWRSVPRSTWRMRPEPISRC